MVVVVVGKARHRRHQSQGKPETNGPNVSMDERPAFFLCPHVKLQILMEFYGGKGLTNHGNEVVKQQATRGHRSTDITSMQTTPMCF